MPPESRGAFAELRRGAAVISQTAAGLRQRSGRRARLAGGRRLRVAAVVEDAVLHGAEIAVAAGDPRVPPLRTTVVAALPPITLRALVRAAERGAAARIVPGGPLPAAGPSARRGPRS